MKHFIILLSLSLCFVFSCKESSPKTAIENKFKLQHSSVIQVQNVIKKSQATFIEIGSKSCYSCQVMGKNIENIKDINEKFNVYFIDIYKDSTALKTYNIEVIPTQIILSQDGNELFRHMGVLTPAEIKVLIAKYKIET